MRIRVLYVMRKVQAILKGNRQEQVQHLAAARLFFAAADPVRLALFRILAERGGACVSDLAADLRMSVAAVSHHLQILRECRCLKTCRIGRTVCYELVPNAFSRFVLRRLRGRHS